MFLRRYSTLKALESYQKCSAPLGLSSNTKDTLRLMIWFSDIEISSGRDFLKLIYVFIKFSDTNQYLVS